MALHDDARGQRGFQRAPLLLGERAVEVAGVGDDGAEIERGQGHPAGAGFRAGDLHQHGEGAQDAVGLGDGPLQGGAVAAAFAQGELHARLEPGERAAQIVGHAVRHRPQPGHQRLDLVEHRVDRGREAVELVAGAGDRQAPREVAPDDALAGRAHGIDPAQHPAADEEAAQEAQEQRDAERPAEGVADQPFEIRAPAAVAPDQQAELPGQDEDAGADAARALAAAAGAARRHVDPAALPRLRLARPGAEIAGERAEGGAGEEVDAVRVPVGAAPLLDDGDQPAHAARAVLLGQAADLGLDGGVGLPVDDPPRRPVDEREKHQDGGAEKADIEQGQPERRRPEQPMRGHGGCTRRLARCGSRGRRSPCRSSPGAGSHGRR